MNPHALAQDEAMIKSLESMKRVDEKGYLYHMECNYDYYKLPPQLLKVIDAGCSTFFTKNLNNEYILCRNYDYSHFLHNDRHNDRTGINVIVEGRNPNAKYKSIGVCDAFWLDYQNGTYGNGSFDDGKTDLSAALLCPYLCMDGMNEMGLCVSVMALSVKGKWEEIPFDTYKDKLKYGVQPYVLENPGEEPLEDYIYMVDAAIAINTHDSRAWIAHADMFRTTMENKKTLLPPILMRMILDNCKSVEEGIALADNFNITATGPGSAYHIMLADKSGASKLLEWVDNKMVVIDINHATNHYVSCDDGFHGLCGRDETIKAALVRTSKGGMREDYAEHLLAFIAQDPFNGNDRGKTQYSCIYNTKQLKMKVYSFGDFTKSWDYKL